MTKSMAVSNEKCREATSSSSPSPSPSSLRLGRLVKIKKDAVLSQAMTKFLYTGNEETCPLRGDDDEFLDAVVTHVHKDEKGAFTGMVELTLGQYKDWIQAKAELNKTNWQRPSGWFEWVVVRELEKTASLIYVDGLQHPPQVPQRSPEWYEDMKMNIERREAHEAKERQQQQEQRAKTQQASWALRRPRTTTAGNGRKKAIQKKESAKKKGQRGGAKKPSPPPPLRKPRASSSRSRSSALDTDEEKLLEEALMVLLTMR